MPPASSDSVSWEPPSLPAWPRVSVLCVIHVSGAPAACIVENVMFDFNQSCCQALTPSFCASLSSREKSFFWASFYTNLPGTLDSALPVAARLVSAQPWASCSPSWALRFTRYATRGWKWSTGYSVLSICVILWSIRVSEYISQHLIISPRVLTELS